MIYLDLFDNGYIQRTPRAGVSQQRDIDYIRRLYIFNRDAIYEYYHSRNFSVKNTNIISRIIEHLPPHLSLDTHRYLEYVDSKLVYLAKHFRFTSDLEEGVLHPPYFFGNDGEEILFAGYENFNVSEFVSNWKSAPCIFALQHHRNDNRFLLPLGSDDGNLGGLSSLYVDIPKLAVKWREFIRMQVGADVQLTKNHFVIKYVLNTCMDTVIDHTLLNKVMDRFYGRAVVEPTKKHRFKIFEPSTQVDRYVDDTIDMLQSKSLDFVAMLRHIKLVFHDDAANLLVLPEFGATRQSRVALLSTRIDHMCFLIDIAKNKGLSRQHLNDWKRLCERTLRDNRIDEFFSYDSAKAFKEKLQKVIDAA
jgi:hypothetical protein